MHTVPPPSNHKITQGSRESPTQANSNQPSPATHIHTTLPKQSTKPTTPVPPRLKDAGAGHQTRTGMIPTQPMGMSANRNTSDPTLTCSTVPSPHLHASTTLRATRKETLDARNHMAPSELKSWNTYKTPSRRPRNCLH